MRVKQLLLAIPKILVPGLMTLLCQNTSAQTETHAEHIQKTFYQQKEFEVYENVGFFKTYKNTLSFYNKKMALSFSGGHAVQGLALTSKLPDIQLLAEARITYQLNENLQVYSLGKYISKPINNSGMSQTYMNPSFEQSELGLGVKANIYDLEFDMGPQLILDTQSLNTNNSLRINTKISKKF